MKDITMFVMTGCPYCRQAKQAIKELQDENSSYSSVKIHEINETVQPDIADQYDYYYTPTMFIGEDKLYEAHPGESYDECKANVQKTLNAALAE